MKVYPVGIVAFVLVAALGTVTGGCSEQTPGSEKKAATHKTTAQQAQTLRRIESEIRQLSRQQGAFDEKKLRATLKSLSEQLDALIKAQAAAGTSGDRRPTGQKKRPLKHQHPFAPAIRRAKKSLARMRTIKDYSAVISKRERIDGTLLEYETMFVKIRHEPFSVYLKFLGPEAKKGREVIYVEGKHDGKLIAHEPRGKPGLLGFAQGLIPTVTLQPTSVLAMAGNRYPITEIGAMNLLTKLIEVGEQDMKHGEAEAKFYAQARVNGRACIAMRFKHPIRRDHFRFNVAEVFIDQELNMPIRYAAYSWPTTPGGVPVLLEEYTYSQVKLNNGFNDIDFDPKNPKYEYSK